MLVLASVYDSSLQELSATRAMSHVSTLLGLTGVADFVAILTSKPFGAVLPLIDKT